MPVRNVIKEYAENGVYHIYNRGINKSEVFFDARDYKVFLHFLKNSLTERNKGSRPRVKNFAKEIDLLAYCLMPNHFHLLVRQTNLKNIAKFMQSANIRYTMYFNNRYSRTGSVFQGSYKAILIKDNNYLSHVLNYIHSNPSEISANPQEYDYSSYKNYTKERVQKWVKTELFSTLAGSHPARVDPSCL